MGRTLLPEQVEDYVTGLVHSETDAQKRLREETQKMPMARMQIGPDQGAFLGLLVASIGAKRVIEIGTFTGYSSISMARAMPADGELVCCDISEEWTGIARRYWKELGLEGRISLKIGPALETLQGLIESGKTGSFDLAFIDADKTGYDSYYEACLKLLRPNGLIALDNMIWNGKVADPSAQDKDTKAIRALNEKIAKDDRVDAVLATIGDGVMLARKK